ncbi:MAG: iron ABC transporter permease [Oscillospiraceae bacterium]|nr:iron ABC transporter permease [Oscillospiraceae bacterium]
MVRKPNKTYLPVFMALTAALLIALVLALLFGSASLSLRELVTGLQGGEDYAAVIARYVRLPRVAAAGLAGVGLAVSGTLLQGVTDNGLASPNIIGVNAGAGLAVILMLSECPEAVNLLPLAAFGGAFAATLIIVFTAGRIGMSKTTVVLAGMALTSVLNAGISFVSLLDADVVGMYRYFSIGTLAGVQLKQLAVPCGMIALSLGLSLLLARRMDALCLGDAAATALGIRVKSLRVLCLLCASASAAAVVSFAGLLGFVGLIVPHIARRLVGGSMGRVLPASALAGGTLVLLADMLGRTFFAPTELPVGIVMALIGAPFFLFLLLRKGERHA